MEAVTAPLAAALAPGAVRNRLASAAVVSAYGAAAIALVPDPDARGALHYAVVITLGYGHLLGAALPAAATREPTSDVAREPGARRVTQFGRLVALAALVLAFVLFTGWLAERLALVLALLALSTWHTAENDLALEGSYRAGGRPGPLARSLPDQLAAAGITAAILAAGALALEASAATAAAGAGGAGVGGGADESLRARGVDPLQLAWLLRGGLLVIGAALIFRDHGGRHEAIGLALVGAAVLLDASIPAWLGATFADVFAWATGYHLVSWLVLALDGSARPRAIRVRRIVASHTVPLGVALACAVFPGTASDAVRAAFFAPAPYLFWSVAHVGHTLWLRRGRAAT